MFTEITRRMPARPTVFHTAAGVALVGLAEAATAAWAGAAGWGFALGLGAVTGIKALLAADLSRGARELDRLPI